MHTVSRPGTMRWPTLQAVLLAERGEVPAARRRRPFGTFLINATAAMLLCVIGVLTASITLGLVLSS